MTTTTTTTWRVHSMSKGAFTISHSWMAVAPGCPQGPHPTRWCKCKVHRTQEAANEYITEQEEGEQS